MRVLNDRFRVRKNSGDYLGLIEKFLEESKIRAIRYYISDVRKDFIVLEVSYYAG